MQNVLIISTDDVIFFYVIFLYWNNITFDYLVMTYFSCAKVLIFNWCLCDFLVIYWCWHIFVWKMFQNFNIVFDYLLMLTYFSCAKCSYHFQLMFMWFSCTEKHIKVIYWCWHIFVWKMFQNFNIVFDYLVMLTYFSCAKCSYHSRLMFMWFSCT